MLSNAAAKRQTVKNAKDLQTITNANSPQSGSLQQFGIPNHKTRLGIITSTVIGDNEFTGTLVNRERTPTTADGFIDITVLCTNSEIDNIIVDDYFTAFKYGDTWYCTGIFTT